MDAASEKPPKSLPGIASLFDDMERKEIFRKYLYFLGWVELAILITYWLYQISDSRQTEPVFPLRLYFLIAFLAPIAITFLLGTIVAGFNRYFAEPEQAGPVEREFKTVENDGAGKIQQASRMVAWVRKLPFLALLLLLGLGVAFFYKLDAIVTIIGTIGEKSVTIVLTSLGIILLAASIFALILIVLNYRLRKSAMEYQYKAKVAESFGLVILEDNTVLNSSGKLLVNGKKFKQVNRLLPELPKQGKSTEDPCSGPASRPADFET